LIAKVIFIDNGGARFFWAHNRGGTLVLKSIYSMEFATGEEIFRIGDRGHNAFFIESGKVEVSIVRDGKKVVVAELGAGEIVGEMSMIDDAPRSATVTALEGTVAIVIERSRMTKPMTSIDPMMNLLFRVVLARFRTSQTQMMGTRAAPIDDEQSLDEIRSLAFERINSEKMLRDALELGEFEMHYQPIIDIGGGYIAGFEALIRWQKSDGRFVSPVEFIPLAEETGLIVDLGRWILETGLRDQMVLAEASRVADPDRPAPFMSINVSGVQLSDMDETQILTDMIAKSGVVPSEIKLEITESLMVENADHAAQALEKLRETGVSIAIDDFGTGYSSLSYLHQFPLDTLKIDRAFVINMEKSESARRIVLGIIQLALSLELNIVAEGIEEQEQLADLGELGCQYGQGYYMSKPRSLDEIVDLVKSNPSWAQ
jgi:EAL domain-containing protein (putative c-di-GMP-specific phosphodiesterase class I)